MTRTAKKVFLVCCLGVIAVIFATSITVKICFGNARREEAAHATGTLAEKDYAEWMNFLPDSKLVSELSLPGSHNSATAALGGVVGVFAKCQSLPLEQQLACGVRFFDLRPAGTQDLMIYHGASTGITFAEAIGKMVRFLSAHPSEACFVLVQFQKGGGGNARQWAEAMGIFLRAARERFVPFRPDLKLGEMRGKILLLTRTDIADAELATAGKTTPWQDNVADQISAISCGNGTTSSATLYIQDNYAFSTGTTEKISAIKRYLDKAGKKSPDEWLFNFCNVAGTPFRNAKRLNAATAKHLALHAGTTGVVFMDFAGEKDACGDRLLRAVIEQNFLPAH